MITRKNFSPDFKRKIAMEVASGISTAGDGALGQILGYMGYVRAEIAKGKKVRGYIIANSFEERLKYAVKDNPDVSLKAYTVNFSFKGIK